MGLPPRRRRAAPREGRRRCPCGVGDRWPARIGSTRLLQDPRGLQGRQRCGSEEDVSQARAEVPPDSNQGDAKAEAKFKEISEAYSVLSDAEQRKEYDEIRAMGSGARFTASGQGAGGFEDVFSRFGQQGRGQTADFEDIFAMFNQGSGRELRQRTLRAAERRLPRLRRPAARRRRHRAHHARLRHRRAGGDHLPAGRRRQALQGEDPRGRRRRAEDPSARPWPTSPDGGGERRHRGADRGASAPGLHTATGSTCASWSP